MLIIRPSLCANTWFGVDARLWTTAANVACDTTQVLSHLNETNDIYQFQQTLFNYFFASALRILMLMISRAALEPRLSSTIPTETQQLADVEKSTYDTAHRGILGALTLLHTLMESSRSSRLSRRLWSRLLNLGYRIHLLDILRAGGGLGAQDQEEMPDGDSMFSDTMGDEASLALGQDRGKLSSL